jgi:hypothetical protein
MKLVFTDQHVTSVESRPTDAEIGIAFAMRVVTCDLFRLEHAVPFDARFVLRCQC